MKKVLYFIILLLNGINLEAQNWNTQIEDFLNTETNKLKIPELEILIVNQDSILYSKSIGESSPSSSYYIGSVSKSLTAYGVLNLVAQEKLSFETKVIDLLPEIEFSNSKEKLTIRHLLTHTSGIKKSDGFIDLPSLAELGKSKYRIYNRIIEPLKHEYSNLNYSLLGLIIEKVSNLSFGEYMKREVFAPLQMENSKIGTRDELTPQVINHYQYFGLFPVKSQQLNFSKSSIPAGFICSSANDLAKYLQLNLSGGKFNNQPLIDSVLLQNMHTVWDKSDFGYAMGWKQGRYNDKKFYQHLGSTANSFSGIFFIPEKDLGFVILSNSNSLDYSENIAEGVLNILTDGEPKQTSSFEFFLRAGVLSGYLFILINFMTKLVKLVKNKLVFTRRKAVFELIGYVVILLALNFVFPMIAEIPFGSLLKLQPDIGFLILFSFLLPMFLAILKVFRGETVGSQ